MIEIDIYFLTFSTVIDVCYHFLHCVSKNPDFSDFLAQLRQNYFNINNT